MCRSYTLISGSQEETYNIGRIIASLLKSGDVIALTGDLGAGKTVLTKGIASGLDVSREPNSPTFVILNVYQGRLTLNHFDLYRISSADELSDIGFEEIIYGNGVSVIEWADKITELLPEDTITVEISHGDGENNRFLNSRTFTIKGNKEWVLLFKNTVEQASPASKK